jgi:predicted LPLAT superfamily acyltransferase
VDGNNFGLVIIGVVVVAVAVPALFLLRGTEAQRLRKAWFRRNHLPRPYAEESLARHLTSLKERFPGHTEVWYLRRILTDLERDRR